MPSPTGAPFNFAEMPWSYGVKPGQVMEFNAVIRPSPISVPHGPPSPSLSGSPPSYGIPVSQNLMPDFRKRKPDPDIIPVPSKQFLTEEVMSSHLNNLHLSAEYTAHNIKTKPVSSSPPAPAGLDEDTLFGDPGSLSNATTPETYHVCMSPQELEERLKKAQRIAICEEVRKLDSRAEILPQSLLNRIEKPCTALMIWQPPQERIQTLFSKVSEKMEERDRAERKAVSNNNETVSIMTMDDEPLPDLPDYDEDLDFELDSAIEDNQKPIAPDPGTMDIEM
ncbi:AGAP001896-PA-like protein [Anopheles sinensis]|uniref:AGAP001896-PA-like protein n=1 Tax=Anopheles sinensis TaxID=74873 RepID=A0A084VRX6_ANOSI|nr:AGAP001896-PA-like protein [Anopheles sinensis]